MTPDFTNGANVTELSEERAKKAEELNEYMKDLSNSRKSGKAETFRFAIDRAYEKLEEIKEEKQEKIDDIQELREKEKQMIEDLKD